MLKHPLIRFFASFKLAVVLILTLALVLAVATGIESVYGTRAVKILVYGTPWFTGLLIQLVITLTSVALTRFPWKRHQTGFVFTHLGIIVLLFGAWLTSQFGVDGNLPIREGSESNQVILNDLVLEVLDDDKRIVQIGYESAREKLGTLKTVEFSGAKLVMDRFLPRVVANREIKKSPLANVGAPAVQVTLSNSRFSVTEWLHLKDPGTNAQINLGPAILSLGLVTDENQFVQSEKTKSKKNIGTLVVERDGKNYRVRVEDALKQWMRMGSGMTIKVERYLPYATVVNNQLVSKSNEPKNPAVTLVIRDRDGREEKHSIFAFFPEFATIHRTYDTQKAKNMEQLGVKIIFEVENSPQSRNLGQLKFGQTKDSKSLIYMATTTSTNSIKHGAVEIGKSVATGWMDLSFKVDQWIPFAVEEMVPTYIDKISGSDQGFLTAGHFTFSAPGTLPESFWLLEGAERDLPFPNRVVSVALRKEGLQLPFSIQLDNFTIKTDPGTEKAAGYESMVSIRGDKTTGDNAGPSTKISMNEPLTYGGYTFYQSSYQLVEGAPPISIFSVNYDPGRILKYLGSLILTLGIGLMFYMNPHYWNVLLGRKSEAR